MVSNLSVMDIMLKGVGTAEDVVLAKQHGVKGVVLSNHGGRQLDFARSGIEVLPSNGGAKGRIFARRTRGLPCIR